MLTPDGAASAAGQVRLSYEAVLDIARRVGRTHDHARDERSQFTGTPLHHGMFGQSAAGKGLGTTHEDAHTAFERTVAEALATLRDFEDQLVDTVKEYEARDQDVQAALTAAARRRPQQHGGGPAGTPAGTPTGAAPSGPHASAPVDVPQPGPAAAAPDGYR